MRNAALIVLLLGWGLMNWKLVHARDITSAALAEGLRYMPEQDSCPRKDVALGMIRAANSVWDRTATPMWFFGLSMFVAGLCLAFCPPRQNAARRPIRASHATSGSAQSAGSPSPEG